MLKGIAKHRQESLSQKVYKLQQPVLNIEKKECDSAAKSLNSRRPGENAEGY